MFLFFLLYFRNVLFLLVHFVLMHVILSSDCAMIYLIFSHFWVSAKEEMCIRKRDSLRKID